MEVGYGKIQEMPDREVRWEHRHCLLKTWYCREIRGYPQVVLSTPRMG